MGQQVKPRAYQVGRQGPPRVKLGQAEFGRRRCQPVGKCSASVKPRWLHQHRQLTDEAGDYVSGAMFHVKHYENYSALRKKWQGLKRKKSELCAMGSEVGYALGINEWTASGG